MQEDQTTQEESFFSFSGDNLAAVLVKACPDVEWSQRQQTSVQNNIKSVTSFSSSKTISTGVSSYKACEGFYRARLDI